MFRDLKAWLVLYCKRRFISSRLHRGDRGRRVLDGLSRFPDCGETVETVDWPSSTALTPLKRGVNEMDKAHCSRCSRTCAIALCLLVCVSAFAVGEPLENPTLDTSIFARTNLVAWCIVPFDA